MRPIWTYFELIQWFWSITVFQVPKSFVYIATADTSVQLKLQNATDLNQHIFYTDIVIYKANSNDITKMDSKQCPTEGLDLSNLADCNAAIQLLLKQRHVLTSWYESCVYECERVLAKFSSPLCFGNKSIELSEKAFDRLEKHHATLRDCNVKLKYIYEARFMKNYTATEDDTYLFQIIMDSFDETDAKYENTLFATQRLIDSQIKARDENVERCSTPGPSSASSSPSPSSSTSSQKRLPRQKVKPLEFVDFSTLSGKEKISAMQKRGFCTNCRNKQHSNPNQCKAKGHRCQICDIENHFESACAWDDDISHPNRVRGMNSNPG